MAERSRRKLLAALAGMAALAGCGGAEPSPTAPPAESEQPIESPSPTPTESSTESPTASPTATATQKPIESSDFEFVTSVARQPSESAPGRIRASLTNRSGVERTFSGGDPLPVSASVTDGPADDLLVFPDQADTANDYWWESGEDGTEEANIDDVKYDGCWRAPAPLWSTAAGAVETVPADLTIAGDYYPLAHSTDGCPTGTYTVAGGEMGVVVDNAQLLRTEMTIEITNERLLSVSGSLTVADE